MLQLDAKSSLSHTQWWELLEDSQSGHFKHHWSLLTGHGEIPGNCLYPYTEVFFISLIFTIQCMLYLANLWCHLARQRRERNHLCSVERELEARKLFSYLQYSALWLQWKHHTSLASQMPLLPVFHILMILKKKKKPIKTQTRKETWATTLDLLEKLHSKVKYMHSIQTLCQSQPPTSFFWYLQ